MSIRTLGPQSGASGGWLSVFSPSERPTSGPDSSVSLVPRSVLARALQGGVATTHCIAPHARRRSPMGSVVESIDVKVPVSTAYNQWTQFEEFPHFMEGVKSVTQTDDMHLHWVAEVAGKEKEWDAEVTEQHPDERVAWNAV